MTPAQPGAGREAMPSERGAATPGPWRVLQDNCGGGCNISINGPKGPVVIARTVAVRSHLVLHGRASIEEEEAQANARLIAAAPDLLAALRDTLRMLEAAHRQLGMRPDDNKRVVAAKAILAAAGEPPR